MFKTAAIIGALASPALGQTPFSATTLDCEVIFLFISQPEVLADWAVFGIDAAIQGAASTMTGGTTALTPKIAEACRAEPTLSFGAAIRVVSNQ